MPRHILTKEEKAARERARAQSAFSTILSAMADIAREEVSHAAIELWRSDLNMVRKFGEKIKVKDFLVGVEQADPFNVDAPVYKELGEWFVEQWQRFKPGATTVHVRGLHYAISALAGGPDAVKLPNGMIYDNTMLRWHDLERAGKYARYLGLIDPDIFQDRRSRDAITKEFETSSQSLYVYGFSLYEFEDFGLPSFPEFPEFPEMPEFPSLPHYSFRMEGQQRYRLEVWIEKSTQEDVILPVCDKHEITSVTAQGEISVSSMWKAIKRAEQYNSQTTTVILYISDFDPSGQSMPVAAARKLEFLRMLRRSSVNMRLYPIALTSEQCIQFQLPRTPIKESDGKRTAFEYRYGDGATELDALESLHPGELAELLEQAILRFRDHSVSMRVRDKEWEIKRALHALGEEIQGEHELDELKEEYETAVAELAEIESAHDSFEDMYTRLEERYDREVRAKFDTWRRDYFEPLAENLQAKLHTVGDDMQAKMPNVEDYEIPEAEEVPLADDCLYDSSRSYVAQLSAYKQFAGKFDEEEEDEDEAV